MPTDIYHCTGCLHISGPVQRDCCTCCQARDREARDRAAKPSRLVGAEVAKALLEHHDGDSWLYDSDAMMVARDDGHGRGVGDIAELWSGDAPEGSGELLAAAPELALTVVHLSEQIAAALALHTDPDPFPTSCPICCDGDTPWEYPCATARALGATDA